MDITTLRIAVTLVSFAAFLGVMAWAMSPGKRRDFEEAAMLPFNEDEDRGA